MRTNSRGVSVEQLINTNSCLASCVLELAKRSGTMFAGDVQMQFYHDDNRRSISGKNIIGDNTNLGDNVSQSKIEGDQDFNSAYDILIKEIMQMQDQSQRETTKYLAEQLKSAYEKRDKPGGLKLINLIKGIISTGSSLASLAHIFGMI